MSGPVNLFVFLELLVNLFVLFSLYLLLIPLILSLTGSKTAHLLELIYDANINGVRIRREAGWLDEYGNSEEGRRSEGRKRRGNPKVFGWPDRGTRG